MKAVMKKILALILVLAVLPVGSLTAFAEEAPAQEITLLTAPDAEGNAAVSPDEAAQSPALAEVRAVEPEGEPVPETPVTEPGGEPVPEAPVTEPGGELVSEAPVTEPGGEPVPEAPVTEPGGEAVPEAPVTESGGEPVPEAPVTEPEGEPVPEAPVTEPEGETVPETAITSEPALLPNEILSAPNALESASEGGELTAIRLPGEIILEMGEVLQLKPELEPAGANAQLNYRCEPTSALHFHDGGFIIAAQEGLAQLFVYTADGVSASCPVLVLPAGMVETINYTNVSLPGSLELEVGQSHQLQPECTPAEANAPLYYDSLDPDICAVDENGLLTAKKPGDTQIRLSYSSGPLRMSSVYMDVTVYSNEHFFDVEKGVLLSYRGPGGALEIPDGVTEIGDNAFGYETPRPITAVSIPGSVQKIGNGAFEGLKELARFDLPSGLTHIGDNAFRGCESAEFSELPSSLTHIGAYAFSGCGKAAFTVLPGSLDAISDGAFEGTGIRKLRLPASVTEIGKHSFSGCDHLADILIPGTVKDIGYAAFSGCTGIESIIIEEGVETIGSYAFSGANFTSITIPGSVSQLYQHSFSNIRDLKSVTISWGVGIIWGDAFYGCDQLEFISLPASVSRLDGVPFSTAGNPLFQVQARSEAWRWCVRTGVNYEVIGTLYESDIYVSQNGLLMAYYGKSSDLVIPEGITSVSVDAFIPKNITSLTLPEGFTSIAYGNFDGYPKLHTVNLPESLQKIGDYAFCNCDDLREIDLTGSRLKTIGSNAFSQCDALSVVRLGASIESIGSNAFGSGEGIIFHVPAGSYALQYCVQNGYNCRLEGESEPDAAFVIENGVLKKYVGNGGHADIPEGVTEIGASAFRGQTALSSVSFPASLKRIGDNAFSGSGLSALRLPDGVEFIGSHAFSDCAALTEARLPDHADTQLRAGIFENCVALERVILPDSLTTVGESMFRGCERLTDVQLPAGLRTIRQKAFADCSALRSITLPEGLTRIEGYAFSDCSSLETLSIPDSAADLDSAVNMLDGCSALRSVRLPDGMQHLPGSFFNFCTSLRSVTLPKGLKSIDSSAFYNCTSLKDAYIPSSVKTVGVSAFGFCPELTVRCEKGSYAEKYCKSNNLPYSTSNVNPGLLSFPEGDHILGVGQQISLKLLADASVGSVSFKSSGSAVSVDKLTGAITAKKTGSATITATAASGLKATCKITVKAAPKSVSFDAASLILTPGETYGLSVTLTKNSIAELSFSSGNAAVLTVNRDGLVTAIAPGTADVTVTTHNGKSAVCTITVANAPETVYLNQTALTLRQTLSAQLLPSVNEGSYCGSYSFASSDPAIARVDADGNVTGVAKGATVITVTTPNGVQAQCSVTVIAAPPRLSLPAELELGVKETRLLTPEYIFEEGSYSGTYSFTSKSAKIAKVDENGLVTAVRTGSTVITVSTQDGITAECRVTVKKAPSSIKLDIASRELGVGETVQLVPTLSKNSASAVNCVSSDPAVLEVSPDGMVRAIAPGSATVTASTFNGRQASAAFTVKPAPVSIAFAGANAGTLRVLDGQTGVFDVILSAGSGGSYTFSSDMPGALAVDPITGEFEARGRYNTRVTVTSYNGLTAEVLVTAGYEPEGMYLPVAETLLAVGDSYQIRPILEPAGSDVNPCSFKSSSTKVAAVDENGLVTAKKTGTATITVKTYNGLSAKLKISVKKAPESIALNTEAVALGQYEEFQLATAFFPKNSGAAVTYTSSNSTVASVSPDGLIYARQSYGMVTITATSSNGLSASCLVDLGPAPRYLHTGLSGIQLNVGMKMPVNVDIGDAHCSTFYVGSSDPKIATFDEYGRIVAKRKGIAQVAIETYNGMRSIITVNVAAAPSKFSLTLPEEVQIGAIYKLCDYVRSTPAVNRTDLLVGSATVSNGKAIIIENELGIFLMPVESGSFTLKVKTFSGKTLSKKLTSAVPAQPILPDVSSPVRTDTTLADFLGRWNLESVSIEGIAFPPEAAGLKNWYVDVQQDRASVRMEDETFSTIPAVEDGVLVLSSLLIELRCTLHQNGRLSLMLDEEVCLWFSR